jgi:phosphoserine phosphatase
MSAPAPSFATVVLDVDSTISGIEGIDWIAERRGTDVARRIAALTDQAMRGEIPLEQVYGARLAHIQPSAEDLDALSRAYIETVAPDCASTVEQMRHAGIRVVLVSGGLRNAILPLADHLGLAPSALHAVDVHLEASGAYAGFDETSPLSTSDGKRVVIASLSASHPILMVGDGVTDLAARSAVDCFAAFTGFVRRESVVRAADKVLASFSELAAFAGISK